MLNLSNFEPVTIKYTGTVQRKSGRKEWWFRGQAHRTDGAAIDRRDVIKHWSYLEDSHWLIFDLDITKDSVILLLKE